MNKQTELKALRRYGMRWTVLLSLSHDLLSKKVTIPLSIIKEIRTSRVMLESGCFPSCDVNCSLDEIERVLVPKATSFGKKYLESWLDLLGKAMKMQLAPEEVSFLFINVFKRVSKSLNSLKGLTCSMTRKGR